MNEELKKQILIAAVERGMTWIDAEAELESLLSGNTGSYTARIRAIIRNTWGF